MSPVLSGQAIPAGRTQSLGLLLSGWVGVGLKALELQVPRLPGICDLDEVLWKMIYSFLGGGLLFF